MLIDPQQAGGGQCADEEVRGGVHLQLELGRADLEVEVAVEGDEIQQLHRAVTPQYEVTAGRIVAAVAARGASGDRDAGIPNVVLQAHRHRVGVGLACGVDVEVEADVDLEDAREIEARIELDHERQTIAVDDEQALGIGGEELGAGDGDRGISIDEHDHVLRRQLEVEDSVHLENIEDVHLQRAAGLDQEAVEIENEGLGVVAGRDSIVPVGEFREVHDRDTRADRGTDVDLHLEFGRLRCDTWDANNAEERHGKFAREVERGVERIDCLHDHEPGVDVLERKALRIRILRVVLVDAVIAVRVAVVGSADASERVNVVHAERHRADIFRAAVGKRHALGRPERKRGTAGKLHDAGDLDLGIADLRADQFRIEIQIHRIAAGIELVAIRAEARNEVDARRRREQTRDPETGRHHVVELEREIVAFECDDVAHADEADEVGRRFQRHVFERHVVRQRRRTHHCQAEVEILEHESDRVGIDRIEMVYDFVVVRVLAVRTVEADEGVNVGGANREELDLIRVGLARAAVDRDGVPRALGERERAGNVDELRDLNFREGRLELHQGRVEIEIDGRSTRVDLEAGWLADTAVTVGIRAGGFRREAGGEIDVGLNRIRDGAAVDGHFDVAGLELEDVTPADEADLVRSGFERVELRRVLLDLLREDSRLEDREREVEIVDGKTDGLVAERGVVVDPAVGRGREPGKSIAEADERADVGGTDGKRRHLDVVEAGRNSERV